MLDFSSVSFYPPLKSVKKERFKMPSLSEKLNEFERIKSEFDKALNEIKALQAQNINESVQSVVDENLPQIKSELKDELSTDLSEQILTQNTQNKAALSDELKLKVDESFSKQLENEQFNANLKDKAGELVKSLLDERLSVYEVSKLRFQNASSVFALCLVKELENLSEAYKVLAQIEFYEKKLALAEPIFKAYQVR